MPTQLPLQLLSEYLYCDVWLLLLKIVIVTTMPAKRMPFKLGIHIYQSVMIIIGFRQKRKCKDWFTVFGVFYIFRE